MAIQADRWDGLYAIREGILRLRYCDRFRSSAMGSRQIESHCAVPLFGENGFEALKVDVRACERRGCRFMKIAAQRSRRAAYYRLQFHIYTGLGRFASFHQAYVLKIFMGCALRARVFTTATQTQPTLAHMRNDRG